MKSAAFKLTGALLGASLLAGCVGGLQAHRGAVLDDNVASAIQVGVDNKDSVAKTLGRPTFTAQFDPNEWYYVSRDTRGYAFRNPRVKDQTVLRIRFDQAGNVASIQRTGEELVAAVDPLGKKTPTLGRNRSFFEELFGNIGAVGLPGAGSGGGGGRTQ